MSEPVDEKLHSSSEEAIAISRRRHKRHPVNWPARCLIDGQSELAVTILDASKGGFGISRDLPVLQGSRLQIDIDQVGLFLCRIAWKDTDRCGLELLDDSEDLSPSDVEQLSDVLGDIGCGTGTI
ncbi:MAG: hypothetical protein ACI89J_000788 [Hyphomicrobiaceae bacterium]|jgi:hypothetical protein